MLRKSAAALALLLSFIPPLAFGLGLGAVSVESSLNQPLRVRIEVLQLGDTRLEDVTIQMATPEDFQRFNIERAVFLNNIRFSTESSVQGDFVVLTSNQIVREPYLSFILETRWANGRLLSEHTILLDLPVFEEQVSEPVRVQRPISTVLTPPNNNSAPAQANSSVSAPQVPSQAQSVQPVLEPEVISPEPAPQEPAESEETEPAPLSQTSDEDEESAQTEELEEEPVPAEPEDIEATAESNAEDESVAEPITEAATPEAENEPVADIPDTVTAGPNDTLSDIALRVRPDESVSIQQTMLAIQALNPDAFIDGNINRLRRGEVLKVPSIDDIQTVDAREAVSEVSRQNQASAADVQPLAAPANTSPTQDAEPTGQLSVVTAEPDTDGQDGASSSTEDSELDQRIAELENQLALREEEADRARIEREELESRLADLDEQIAAAQEILRLQDLQLAQLQQSLAEAAAQAAMEPQTEPANAPASQAEIPPVQIRQPTLIDTLMSNSLLLIGGAGVLVLLLVVALLRRNKSNKADEDIDEIDKDDFAGIAETQEETNAEAMAGELQDFEKADLDSELDDIISIGEGEKTVVDEETILEAANDDDICAQAVLFVEQGNLDQAQNLLTAAIADNGDSEKLQMSLLDVLAAKQDLSAFEAHADSLADRNSDPINRHIQTLRDSWSSNAEVEFTEDDGDDQEDEDTASFLDDLGIDLDAFDDDAFQLADEPEPVKPENTAPPLSLDDLPEESEPEDIDLTFDLAGDAETADDEPSEPIDEIEEEFSFDDPASTSDQDDSELAESSLDSEPAAESIEEDENVLEFDEPSENAEALADGSSKDAEDLEIDTLEFEADTASEVSEPAQETSEEDLDLETFSFEAPEPPEAQREPETEAAELANDDNVLDFDFDKKEIETPAEEDAAQEADSVESFDFDLDDSVSDTVVEKTEDSTELTFDEFDSESDEIDASDSVVSTDKPVDDDFDFDLNELEIDADESTDEAEISLTDDDFLDLEDSTDAADASSAEGDELAVDDIEFDFDDEIDEISVPADTEEDTDDDLDFLSDDDVDVTSVSLADEEDLDLLSDEDETATKLELAYAYQKMGDAEGAKEILQEVIKEGSPTQVSEAKELIESITAQD